VKPGRWLVALAVLAVSAVCVRLGFWQLDRLHEKRSLNAARRAMLAAPPLEAGDRSPEAAAARGRRVALRGRFDSRFTVLLRGREPDGQPGVEVVTPLVLAGDSAAVLVNRGWLAAVDGATLPPEAIPAEAPRVVIGCPEEPLATSARIGLRRIPGDSVTLWSAAGLTPDSLRGLFPYTLAPYVFRELPGPGVPAAPRRSAPEPLNESLHLGYAIQWFLIAALVLGGSLQLARARAATRGASRPRDDPPA
jgi:surfeit locus 1 family protein